MRRQHSCDASVGGVDVKPECLSRANVGNVRHGIDARRGGCSNGRDHGKRKKSVGTIASDRAVQVLQSKPEILVNDNPSNSIETEPDRDCRFVDGRVRLFRAIDTKAWNIPAR